jgi:cytoskeletal protein RodZ
MNQTKQIEYSDSESDEEIISDSESESDSSTDSSSESDDEPVPKKTVVKKPAAKKPVVKKTAAKKTVAKKTVAKKTVAKKDNIQEIIGETGIKATSSPQFTISKNTPMKKYYNQNLRNAMIKQNLNPVKIDKIMEKMKITPQTKITKELINEFLNQIK